ncbi:hypothetical protein NDU88_005037 [Pleurodeles waltl]|uniref:Uncharacterized protein n=1 Tax=Pleurodeles waltl TaxID=8319 RepID=A0AAV7QH42_PLEWA|nr:hypothetical protein NDU88_005037 [Pleurodeles waltl]
MCQNAGAVPHSKQRSVAHTTTQRSVFYRSCASVLPHREVARRAHAVLVPGIRGVPSPGRMRAGEGPRAAGARTPDTAGPVSSLQPPAAPLFHPPLTVSRPATSLFTFLLFLQAYFVSAWPDQRQDCTGGRNSLSGFSVVSPVLRSPPRHVSAPNYVVFLSHGGPSQELPI